jgi:hypothetical protein
VTVDERREQRVRVRMDLEDAQGELNALQVKAERMAEALDRISNKIRHNAQLKPSPNDFDLQSDLNNRLHPAAQSELSYEEILKVIESLRLARQKVVNLGRQEKQLSATAGWTVAS